MRNHGLCALSTDAKSTCWRPPARNPPPFAIRVPPPLRPWRRCRGWRLWVERKKPFLHDLVGALGLQRGDRGHGTRGGFWKGAGWRGHGRCWAGASRGVGGGRRGGQVRWRIWVEEGFDLDCLVPSGGVEKACAWGQAMDTWGDQERTDDRLIMLGGARRGDESKMYKIEGQRKKQAKRRKKQAGRPQSRCKLVHRPPLHTHKDTKTHTQRHKRAHTHTMSSCQRPLGSRKGLAVGPRCCIASSLPEAPGGRQTERLMDRAQGLVGEGEERREGERERERK